jgi:hypothetical protein
MATFKGLIGTLAGLAIVALAWSTVAAAQTGSGQPGVVAFLSAINSTGDELKALNAEKSISTHDIHTFSLEKISNAGNTAAISRAIAKNSAQIAVLRGALKTNPTVVAALSAAGVSVDQVIAIDVDPGSEIHIFYQ